MEKGTLAALCEKFFDYPRDGDGLFSDEGKHFSLLLGKASLPSWPLPFTATPLPCYRTLLEFKGKEPVLTTTQKIIPIT